MDSKTTFDISTLITTIDFAAKKHVKQRRKDSDATPYINHPIGVAKILVDAGVTDVATLQAAVLHDTVEDTNTTFEELEEYFGKEVEEIVKECTDDKTLPVMERKRLQIETTPHKSVKAKLVKLADKLYNLKDIQRCVPVGWTVEYAQGYYTWAKKVTDGKHLVDSAKGVNDGLTSQLEELYKSGTFEHRGMTYKCHPTYT
ncbi:8692_t:CDS:2 [Paraglomus brasilianum]|uniref:Guanosine-3',5'-bis(diphosphate) 3'-pyrophosphohydrolase MESH1 n=1 Tax=Paraglomus brasilianum TaxID=144538 RepID=A0A9N8ZYS0_9GLOM|nr:8692_t:CDS:2 [Paraglomus brasilianum]